MSVQHYYKLTVLLKTKSQKDLTYKRFTCMSLDDVFGVIAKVSNAKSYFGFRLEGFPINISTVMNE